MGINGLITVVMATGFIHFQMRQRGLIHFMIGSYILISNGSPVFTAFLFHRHNTSTTSYHHNSGSQGYHGYMVAMIGMATMVTISIMASMLTNIPKIA